MSIDMITLWHQRARPNPTEQDFNVQLGCHFEEFGEMLETLVGHTDSANATLLALRATVEAVASRLKDGTMTVHVPAQAREAFLDSLADQIVTATGTGHCAGLHITEAVRRVNSSNWSKYVDGQPLFDANGKITKGPDYRAPDLTGLY